MASTRPDRPFLPIAAWYTAGPSRATMVEPLGPDAESVVRRDLAHLRESGFNTVRAWIDWASGEPEPGRYDFRALERVLAEAGRQGLRVMVQIYLDSAPDWLLQHYPDARYVSQGGQAIDSQGSPGYCYDHPGVRQAAEAFMRALAGRLRDEPAFLAYDLWSEPHVVQWAYFDYLPQPALFCYCHYSRQRFRSWLRARYGELESLNRAWYRRFPSWEAVEPPRFISLMTYTDFIDWQRFIIEKITQDLAWRARTVKAVDPVHPVTSHSAVPAVMTMPLLEQGEPDDWQVARVVDVWGTSFYPKHVGARETADPAVRGAYLDSTRSASASVGRPFWLGELQGGHGYVGSFAEPVTGADVRAWTWGPLAHGAKGLCFYAWRPMSRGYESGGFGLTRPDGSPTDRSRAAGEVARIVERHAELFACAQVPQAEAAVVWNNDANILWGCLREKSPYVPSRSHLGAYRALFEHHFPADFVHPDQIAALATPRVPSGGPDAGAPAGATGPAAAGQGGPGAPELLVPGTAGVAPGPEPVDVRRYRVLYMPFAILVRRDVARGLEAFVRAGGTVVAEARTGWNDEHGRVDGGIPGSGLEALFGAREAWTRSRRDGEPVEIELDPDPAMGLEGGRVEGAVWEQALESAGARVAGRFPGGAAAVTVNEVGRGRAVLVGSLVSYAYQVRRHPPTGRFLAAFAAAAGVRRPVEVEGLPGTRVEGRLLAGQTRQEGPYALLFAFNHTDEPVAARLRVAPPWEARRVRVAELTGADVLEAHAGPDGRIAVERALAPREIAVFKLQPA